MSEIKRYEPYIVDVKDDPTNGALKQASMCEVPDGRYVLFEDHVAVTTLVQVKPAVPT